jgi:hypothetical protein
MIYVAVVRECVCEICSGQWTLQAGESVPKRCIHCASLDWLYGREPMDAVWIRQRVSRDSIEKNPGAKSRTRQERGRAQGRGFKPYPQPKDVDEGEEPTDN